MSCSKSDEKELCKELQTALEQPVNNQNSRKAYRKFALKYHPDKYSKDLSTDEKKKLETKFKKISNLYENCTEKAKNTGVGLCSSISGVKTPKSDNKPKQPKTKKEKRVNADCIRRTSNWSKINKENKFESKFFDKEATFKDISICSPKLESLLNNIKKLDEADLKNEGKVFKHVIYSDVKQMGHGIKIIASGLESVGFLPCMKKDKTKVLVEPSSTKFSGYGMMISTTLFGLNVSQSAKKNMLSMFNERPGNVHGSSVRIMLVDNGYKEGIDLYDVKYMHIFEPQTTKADFRQAMGRATRLCGQKGLKFVPNKGWKLDVFTYHLTHKFDNGKTIDLHDLFMKYSSLDLENIKIQEELEKVAIESAVDYDLNQNVNKFVNEKTSETLRITGGATGKFNSMASKINCDGVKFTNVGAKTSKTLPFSLSHMELMYKTFKKGSLPKLPKNYKKLATIEKRKFFAKLIETNKAFCQRMVDFIRDTRFSNLHKKSIFQSNDTKVVREFYSTPKTSKTKNDKGLVLYEPKTTKSPPKSPEKEESYPLGTKPNKSDYDYEKRRSETFEEFKKRINREFSSFKYDKVQVKNMCDLPQQDSDRIVKFTPSQDFISHYFVPKNDEKGLLVWHSVGTGKTCTAIATKSKTWEKEGYTILWVTRTTLRNDIWKNMFQKVCDYMIKEKLKKGEKIPADLFKKKIGEIRKYLNINFMEPVSFKQFSNAAKKINSKDQLGKTKNLFYDLVKKNGSDDPLRKTLIIIDEAHKLLSKDLVGQEKPDFDAIQKSIFNSYSVSKKESCRVLMMTATPFLDDPRDFFKTMNLIIADPNKRIPEELDEFKKKFKMTDNVEFTKEGIKKLQSTFQGKISYLDRRFDPTQFTQPVFTKVASKMSVLEKDFSELKKQCDDKLDEAKKDCDKKMKENIDEKLEKVSKDIESEDLSKKILENEEKMREIEKKLKSYSVEMEEELKNAAKGTKQDVRAKWRDKINDLKSEFKVLKTELRELNNKDKSSSKEYKKQERKIKKEEKDAHKKCIKDVKKEHKKCIKTNKEIFKKEAGKYQLQSMISKCGVKPNES